MLRTTGRKRREVHHEEMQAQEWDVIYGNLSEITVQLTGKLQTVVTLPIAALAKLLGSPYVGVANFRVRKHMSYKPRYQMA